jgi:serine/threonine protein kinase
MDLFVLLSQNIGFDIRGDIKIFDFGLAKELKPIKQEGVDKYVTSGVSGTRRYMAPGVIQVKPYGKRYLCPLIFLQCSVVDCIVQCLSCHRFECGCVLFRNTHVGNVDSEGSVRKTQS